MVCENCGKDHNGSYGSGRFCCKECARSFSTKKDYKNLKLANCIDCNSIIYIGKRASAKKCRCEYCNKKHILNDNLSRSKKCKICGEKYINSCKNDFCIKHNIQGFNLLINYFGFDKTKLGTKNVIDEYNRIRKIIYDLYWKDNLSALEIAKKFNFSSKHYITQTVFKFLNIPIRSFKKSTKNAYFNNRMPFEENNKQFKTEHHITWNDKNVFLRSSYEIDYANELDKNKINYDVETLRIKYFDTQRNEYRCAIPDFYLPETNTIVEIKSTWTLDVQQMKDKVKAYKDLGYDFKLIVDHVEENIDNIFKIENKKIIYK